ncbi:MAG: hypothetical protein R2704_01795 [Microthrixaceae bacterium]
MRAEQDLLVDGAREDAPEGLSDELDEFEQMRRAPPSGSARRAMAVLSYADQVAITEAAARAYYR